MNPWTFGWTQLLTIVGFIITIFIAIGGFRTFNRWKREKIEEKRIETAIEALALVYESKFVFDHIRSPMAFGYEWVDMPDTYGDEQQRSARGPFYAVLKRIQANKEFFDRAWKMQVRCTALFGRHLEEIFLLVHRSRRQIEMSAWMLLKDPEPTVKNKDNMQTWDQFRADVWGLTNGDDTVGSKLKEFKEKMEQICRPIVDREYGKVPSKGIVGRIADWLGV